MSVVTTNVKVTDLGSKEADEVEEETDVWTRQWEVQCWTPIYVLLQNEPFLSCLVVGRSLNIRNRVPIKCRLVNNAYLRLAQIDQDICLLLGSQTWRGASSDAWPVSSTSGTTALE